MAVAVMVCAFLLSRDATKAGLSPDIAFDLLFWLTVGGIIGARIFYVMISWDHFADNLGEIVMINRGGLAWQGGFIGGFSAGAWFVKVKKLKLRIMLDLCAPYIALGQAIGRSGCFFNGCCYGKPWAFGIYFPVHQARLHPTQLYETSMLFGIFLVLKFLKRPNLLLGLPVRQAGMVFVLYLWLAAIERFTVEFFRADHETLLWGLSLFQFIAVGIFAVGCIVFFRIKR